ncbi:MAG: hypothetical protein AB7V04_03940 [Desulfomonilaceae bacterium]
MSSFNDQNFNRIHLGVGKYSPCVHSLILIIVGITLAIIGGFKLHDIYGIFVAQLPLESSESIVEKISSSWLKVSLYFVSFVSSLSAVLFGISWFLGGVSEFVDTLRISSYRVGALQHPEKIADLLTHQSLGHPIKNSRFLDFGLSYSPVSKLMVKKIFWSSLKVIFLWILVAAFFFALQMLPAFLKLLFGREFAFSFQAHSFSQIHVLFISVLLLNLLMGILLVSRKTSEPLPSKETFQLSGNFPPSFYLSIFQNAFRLLSPNRSKLSKSYYMTKSEEKYTHGSMIESMPVVALSVVTPIAFILVPLCLYSMVMGFWSLIDFTSLEVPAIENALPSSIMQEMAGNIFFYLGLIWSGSYFSEWVRILLGVRRFQSTIGFCTIRIADTSEAMTLTPSKERKIGVGWRLDNEDSDELVSWAKDPSLIQQFSVSLLWIKAVTESMVDSSSRYFYKTIKDTQWDQLVKRVLELTQNLRFEKTSRDQSIDHQNDHQPSLKSSK